MSSTIEIAGVETSLPTSQPSIPADATNESPRRSRRFRKFRSFFSCLLPRPSVYQNRWNKTCKFDSKCKSLTTNLVIKTIGKDGIIVDDTGEEPLDVYPTPKNMNPSKGICYNSIKSMDSEDSSHLSDSDSPPFSRRNNTLKIGMHQMQTSEKGGEVPRASSRRIIDCSQDCPICWDSFKVGEQVCWSKNISCRHGFHLDCMLVWLKDHAQCPLCRCDYMRQNKSFEVENE